MPTYEDLMEGNWYAELYEEMTPKLISYISVKTGDWERAQDLTQDVWVKHYNKFEEVIDQGPCISIDDLTYQRKWLYTAAKNARTDELRKKDVRKRYERSISSSGAVIPTSEDPVVRKEDDACVRKVLAAMNDKHAEALELKDMFGYGYPEIADIVEMSRNSIGQTLTRARDAFEELLEEICPDLYLEQTT